MSLRGKILHKISKLTEYAAWVWPTTTKKDPKNLSVSTLDLFTCIWPFIVFIHVLIFLYMYIPDLRLSLTRPLTLSFQRTCQSQIRPVPSTTSSSTQAVLNAEIFLGKDDWKKLLCHSWNLMIIFKICWAHWLENDKYTKNHDSFSKWWKNMNWDGLQT